MRNMAVFSVKGSVTGGFKPESELPGSRTSLRRSESEHLSPRISMICSTKHANWWAKRSGLTSPR